MSTPSWFLSRRTLLQTAGTALALPVLEAMIRPGRAQAQPVAPPRRFLAVHGLVYGYVSRPDTQLTTAVAPWSALAVGRDVPLENNSYLKPFFDRNIASKITLLTGITDRVMIGTHDSPVKLVANTFPVAKYSGGCVILTGTPGPTNTVGPPPQVDPFNGATADQIAARVLGKSTFVPSLSLAVMPVGGNFAGFTMSNKDKNTPIPADRDPLTVFNRLFAGYNPQATRIEILRRAKYRKSVLDGVRAESASLRGRLGQSDQRKLDQYLDSVRSLEQTVDQSTQMLPLDVTPPGAIGSYANTELVQQAMQDLIVQAFVTDRTRVVAFSGQYPGTYLKFRGAGQAALGYDRFRQFSGAPLNGDHHSMSHYDQGLDSGAASAETTAFKKDWMHIYAHWSLQMYAELLAKLDAHLDIDGQSTVLDNTVAVWGGDDSDSAQHAYLSMPCVLGGRGGATATGWRIKSGRQLRFESTGVNERSWKDLLWGMLNIVGVGDPDGSPRLKSFGYAKQPLDLELGA
jgi:hypothetical protein